MFSDLIPQALNVRNRLDDFDRVIIVGRRQDKISKPEQAQKKRFVQGIIFDSVKLEIIGFAGQHPLPKMDPLSRHLVAATTISEPFANDNAQRNDRQAGQDKTKVRGEPVLKGDSSSQ